MHSIFIIHLKVVPCKLQREKCHTQFYPAVNAINYHNNQPCSISPNGEIVLLVVTKHC